MTNQQPEMLAILVTAVGGLRWWGMREERRVYRPAEEAASA
ncbi:hypothetical protein [Thiohalocapsa sp.]|jgi:hypothetical protein|nr:hypothetical protein [Thiohalocapsa sp.]